MSLVSAFTSRLAKRVAPLSSPSIIKPERPEFTPRPIYRIDGLQFKTELSPNLLFELPHISQVSTDILLRGSETKELAIDFRSTQLIEDPDFVFTPLGRRPVNGKNYSRTLEAKQRRLFGDWKQDGFVKAYRRRKTPGALSSYESTSLTIWDLIFPSLLPPLDHSFEGALELFKPLYKFQPAGVGFLVNNESALLADEMGTGKTVMTVVALKRVFRTNMARKALIVCPVSLLRTWQDHLSDWADELHLTVVRGTREMRALDWKYPAHVYLTTYDTVRSDLMEGDASIAKSFDVVVLDEAQYIKNPTSGRSRAVKLLGPKFRWALTGTPMENRLDELIALFGFIKPDLFKGESYVTPSRAKTLIEPYSLRRLKKDVIQDLPPKLKQEIWLELNPEQRRVYDKAERTGIVEIEKLGELKRTHVISHILPLIMKLKQICNFAPGMESSAKTEELRDLVEQIKLSGQKVLVFSQFVGEGVDKLESVLQEYGTVALKGGMSDAARNAAITDFKSKPDICVFLATIKTGGVGLTLTEASYVIHFDHWWNPAVMWQADDRVHRIGQKASQVNIYSFWAQNTIEERIHSILQEKGLLFDEVINRLSVEEVDRMISPEDWLKVLGIKGKIAIR